MKRYFTIDVIEGSKLFDYKMCEHEKGPYICDRSRFIPVSELAKSVASKSIGAADLGRYDFPDGKDDGRSVPLARRRPELAEMSVEVRRQQKQVRQQVEKAAAVDKFKREVFGDVESQGTANESSQNN